MLTSDESRNHWYQRLLFFTKWSSFVVTVRDPRGWINGSDMLDAAQGGSVTQLIQA